MNQPRVEPDDRPDDVAGGTGPRLPRFEIDRRPILVVVVARLWRQLAVAGLLLLFVWAIGVEAPEGLDARGWKTLCIFGLCAVLWATGLIPLAITSLLAMCLIPLTGVLTAQQTYGYFGSRVVFFIMAALMLSAALVHTGLSKRIATSIVRRFGRTPRRLVLSVFVACAVASTFMIMHAVAAMALPIVIDITRALRLDPRKSQLGAALAFALAWGCAIGGSLTVLGGARGPLAIGILEGVTGRTDTISFTEYMVYGAPLAIVMFVAGALVLTFWFKPEIARTGEAIEILAEKIRDMGKPSPREYAVGLVMVATIVAWMTWGDALGLDTIAIFAMAALFLLRAVSWQAVEQRVSWGVILMYGGAICLSAAMTESGAARWLTDSALAGGVGSPTVMLVVLAVTAALLTEFMSNAAVVAMMLPPALSLATQQGIDLEITTMAVVLPTNFAFMFPISSPPMALAWSTGYLTGAGSLRTGSVLNLVGLGCMVLLVLVWWPMLGLL